MINSTIVVLYSQVSEIILGHKKHKSSHRHKDSASAQHFQMGVLPSDELLIKNRSLTWKASVYVLVSFVVLESYVTQSSELH